MESLKEFSELGKSLGLEGNDLRRFISEQQAILRDERAALRQKEKEENEYRIQFEKTQLERERLEKELKQQSIAQAHQLEMLSKQSELNILPAHTTTGNANHMRGPKIPPFEDGKDEIDSYLRRFERYAIAQKWSPDIWATNLSALLKGNALDVYALMPADKALDYEALKTALLKRYDLTEDGFKKRFRACRPMVGETFAQYSVRLDSYFQRWLEMAKIDKTYDSLYDLMVRDQFIHVCSKDLSLFLKERIPDSLDKMALLADQYREARYTCASNLINKGKPVLNSSTNYKSSNSNQRFTGNFQKKDPVDKFTDRNHSVSTGDRRCYKCGKHGHIANNCFSKTNKVNSVVTNTNPKQRQRYNQSKWEKWHSDSNTQVCGACIISTESIIDSFPSSCTETTLSSHCQILSTVSMPVSSGYVNGNLVSVLRDTGCSGIVIKRSMIDDVDLTGKTQSCFLADGTRIDAPVALISIDTPYFKGEFEAWCMDSPVYDLILGNVYNVRDPGNPDPKWQPVCTVETRQQARMKSKPYVKLKVQDIVTNDVTPSDVIKAQGEDPSLEKIRKFVVEGNTIVRPTNGRVDWFKKGGLIYRKFVDTSLETEQVYVQLVVPQPLRETVIKLAHESIMSGHMGIRRTLDRVLTSFYWPGITSDVKRFCQSCDICQRTVPKGKVNKVPLQKMPLIDEPFKRVAVDLVGPLYPLTDRGNRYILTLVDYATRYPEAVALSGIETERVAEALVDIFCRVGVPQEMLTDMGSQFTSHLMMEVSRLISMKQLTTTVYHPICNGLVERFNGSLKLMLKRMCAERPKDWDKYINPLLFAYREIPQES